MSLPAQPVRPLRPYNPSVDLSRLLLYFYMESVPISRDVLEGKTSLGGSESALLGLANALARRGHDVHIFADHLNLKDDDPTVYSGVAYHHKLQLLDILPLGAPDVFCSLRMPAPFALGIPAGFRCLWNQDMLPDVSMVAHALPALDELIYVSEFHRKQWVERHPTELGPAPSWVTTNGIDFSLIPRWEKAKAPRSPYAFCYTSRPERGLDPLLQMWPEIRRRLPEATLAITRYFSMYEGEGTQTSQMVADFDRKTQAVQAKVGGITLLPPQSKADLYRLLTTSTAMLYPGIHDFGETNCITATEAQACGCLFIGSYRGALPETLGSGAGILVDGDASTREYQTAYIDALCKLVEQTDEAKARRLIMQAEGWDWVFPRASYDSVAESWENHFREVFVRRYEQNKVKVLRQLLHWDHHAAAKLVGRDILDTAIDEGRMVEGGVVPADTPEHEAFDAIRFCDRVIAGLDQVAEHYGTFSIDPAAEADQNVRFARSLDIIANHFGPDWGTEARPGTILDVAAGSGGLALAALRRWSHVTVSLVDYSGANVNKAIEGLSREGFEGRFAVFGIDLAQRPAEIIDDQSLVGFNAPADVVFCGEYVEHTDDPPAVCDWLESFAAPSGLVIITVPSGPFAELCDFHIPHYRGHTHHFTARDLVTMLGGKDQSNCQYLNMGYSPRGSFVGNWIVSWQRPFTGPSKPAQPLPHWTTILLTRPKQTLVVGMLVRNAEEWLHKCLASVWPIADAIVIADTGSTDLTKDIVARFRHTDYYSLPWPERGGFSAVRNHTLDRAISKHHADWFLWIDADEHLVGGSHIHAWLNPTSPFQGYVIRQQHLLLDQPNFHDIPVRVFRTDSTIRFYGHIHEQPENAKDTGVFPSIDLPMTHVVHYGYEDEATRRHKITTRNFPMLMQGIKDDELRREMDYVFVIRDLVTLVGYEKGHERGPLTPRGRAMLERAVSVYTKRFSDPAHKLHHLAFPPYQTALQWLGLGFEVEFAFGAGVPRLRAGDTRATKPRRFIFATQEEAKRVLDHQLTDYLAQTKPPTYDCSVAAGSRPPDVVPAQAPAPVEEGTEEGTDDDTSGSLSEPVNPAPPISPSGDGEAPAGVRPPAVHPHTGRADHHALALVGGRDQGPDPGEGSLPDHPLEGSDEPGAPDRGASAGIAVGTRLDA